VPLPASLVYAKANYCILNFRNLNSKFHSLYKRFLLQDPWKTTLLLKAKNELKKKEDDEDDLT
jgi:hypothetical protein